MRIIIAAMVMSCLTSCESTTPEGYTNVPVVFDVKDYLYKGADRLSSKGWTQTRDRTIGIEDICDEGNYSCYTYYYKKGEDLLEVGFKEGIAVYFSLTMNHPLEFDERMPASLGLPYRKPSKIHANEFFYYNRDGYPKVLAFSRPSGESLANVILISALDIK